MTTMTITAELGAGGDDFLTRVIEAVGNEKDSVYIQVAGEYGHLRIESVEDVKEDQ